MEENEDYFTDENDETISEDDEQDQLLDGSEGSGDEEDPLATSDEGSEEGEEGEEGGE